MSFLTYKVKSAFNEASCYYDNFSVMQYEIAQKLCNLVYINGNEGKILDVGCGTGYIGKILKIENAEFFQIDLSEKMCNIAKKKTNGLSVNCNMDMMPFKENTFDIIISSMAMHWTDNIFVTLKSVLSILKPKSQLYITIPIFGTLQELIAVNKKIGSNFNYFYKVYELKNIIDVLGAKVQYIDCIECRQYYKTFREFLVNMKMTGSYIKKSFCNTKYNIFTLSRKYEKLYVDQGKIFSSWHIMYLIVKK
ncbi:methyltransferase domain-containing protein [Neoehrlichia mikurensis]|uniref:Methyltransferase domain-containing protein n=1 Tax=Neoehrlichia mikurensis TaxID=89586 RepID=A0A9Q9BTB8_9RICK|nr:methyltransferase domain-containing protein [Neoehrlichia mikurensis]QXK92317.1 methyltransferase domain-containing protein [Neoehrlichia mikurensis]QXK92771.1 methyltransferase domain-containing protein [Neoehrlichia mikurensis]QXK94012.1 methyltransferase domain-containing protein [Neoehrlichia mikurensis]UTO55825.1 methyltransferase domain-containing protein [Neoehrlichia mikurensis]UTO56740.1 methyltransferase domain-containing protein [Neoehrlichia mikurensis]